MIGPVGSVSTTAEEVARHRRLVDAAQQFEAVFLQQMLKSTAPDGEEGSLSEDGGGAGQTYSSFATEAVAKAIATAGGLGVARQIVQQVEHAAAGTGKASLEILSTQR